MIRYNLTCDAPHDFEAWFPNSDSFDEQAQRGLLTCPHCNSPKVSKAIMAPRVARSTASEEPSQPMLDLSSGMSAETRKALREMRAKMLAGSENVGMRFADEARRMHAGEIETRNVYGDATPEQARELMQEGIAVMPLPPDLGGH